MHISMFIELDSIVTVFVIALLSVLLSLKEVNVTARLLKVTEITHYLSFIVAMVWFIYWLSHIEELKQVGPVLAFGFQILLYSSVCRVVALILSATLKIKK